TGPGSAGGGAAAFQRSAGVNVCRSHGGTPRAVDPGTGRALRPRLAGDRPHWTASAAAPARSRHRRPARGVHRHGPGPAGLPARYHHRLGGLPDPRSAREVPQPGATHRHYPRVSFGFRLTGMTPGVPVIEDGKLISTNPATGEEVGRFPVAGPAEV